MIAVATQPSETRTIKAGEWLITEGGLPAYFLYKLIKGTVGVYEEGEKLRTIEVTGGTPPHYLGFMSCLAPKGQHSLSVKTESDVEVEVYYVDHIRGLLRHDVSAATWRDIETMIDVIVMGDHIKALRRHIARKKKVDLRIDDGAIPEIKGVLEELVNLYEEIIHDDECVAQTAA
ncbi:MAG: hypothetical protein QF578_20150 [Alphaproteobacteria bacterium]|jgi:CRP-like cAMP-binding protein|nr:hypothetical protein [Alphaproteobacteria bacterium]MDP6815259.1 hypothetical protein [Alphaproteobacteria bacterium]